MTAPAGSSSGDARIAGVRVGRLRPHGDDRGTFREVWRDSWYGRLDPEAAGPDPRFVQANVSTSAPGVLRGLHVHGRQLDHWVVLDGRAFVALVDVRPMLHDAARPVVDTMELSRDGWLSIPVGVAHGFLALEPLTLLYLVTGEYDGTDELGFAWDDPLAAVPWPAVRVTADGRPILSDRDRDSPSLATLVQRLRG